MRLFSKTVTTEEVGDFLLFCSLLHEYDVNINAGFKPDAYTMCNFTLQAFFCQEWHAARSVQNTLLQCFLPIEKKKQMELQKCSTLLT